MALVFLVLKMIYCDCLGCTTHLWYWSSLELSCNQLSFQLHCFQRMIESSRAKKHAQHILTGHWKRFATAENPFKVYLTRYLKRKSLSPPEVVRPKTCNLHILIDFCKSIFSLYNCAKWAAFPGVELENCAVTNFPCWDCSFTSPLLYFVSSVSYVRQAF